MISDAMGYGTPVGLEGEEARKYKNSMNFSGFFGALARPIVSPLLYQQQLAKSQWRKGLEAEKKAVRPVYTRPGEITQSLNLARQTAETGIPQESQDLQQGMLDRSLTYSLGQMESRKAGLMGLGSLYQTSADAANQMASADAQARIQGRQGWQAALQNAATYSDKEFEYNKDQPYQMMLQRAMALQGSALRNQMQARQGWQNLAQQGLSMMMGGGGGLGKGPKFGGNKITPGPALGYDSIDPSIPSDLG